MIAPYVGITIRNDIKSILRAIKSLRTHFAHLRGAERAPQKQTCADSAPADARRERGRSAHGRRDARIAAQGRQTGDGRYSDRAGCRPWADEARILRRTGKRGRSDRRKEAPARPCQPRGPPPPQRNAAMRNAPDREATAPERNLAIAERGGRNAGRRISRASTVGAVGRAH